MRLRFTVAFILSFWMASAALAMGDNVVGQVLDQIQQRFTNAWEWLWDPLWRWYLVGFLILVGCIVIAIFAPFKWIRAALGFFLVLVGAYIAGGRHMRNTYKEQLEQERARRKALEDVRRNERSDGGTSGGGGGIWPFNW